MLNSMQQEKNIQNKPTTEHHAEHVFRLVIELSRKVDKILDILEALHRSGGGRK